MTVTHDQRVVGPLPADAPGEGDAALVARVRAGDERACETLVRRYGGRMLATARRFLGCEAESADAVQDAFLSALRGIGSFAGDSQLSTWLHRIVVNACLMRLRSRRARHGTVSLESLLPAFDETGRHARPVRLPSARAESALERHETCVRVRACIDRLPEPYRQVVLLRDIEEFDTEQTARLLGTSTGVVKTRLHRARQALRALLEPAFSGQDA
jgi:RNA polymerase sigma-70 factor (ECF subfamily)